MIGKTVLVVGAHYYSGYRGVVEFVHEHRNQYGVRLDATARLIMVNPNFLAGSGLSM
jgi:hypothetical protein